MTARANNSSPRRSIRLNAQKQATRKTKLVNRQSSSREFEESKNSRERRGVGRPKGSGKYGEPTKAVRVPVSLVDQLEGFLERRGYVFPIYSDQIQAGFPSPAEDEVPFEPFDLGAKLIPNPASTFLIRVVGESMRNAGIFPNDVLIVDRSLEPDNGDVVVAVVNGEFTVKRLFKTRNRIELRPENKKFRPLVIEEDMEFVVWGVVKIVIHNV